MTHKKLFPYLTGIRAANKNSLFSTRVKPIHRKQNSEKNLLRNNLLEIFLSAGQEFKFPTMSYLVKIYKGVVLLFIDNFVLGLIA